MVEMPQSTALMTRPTAVQDAPVPVPARRLPGAAVVDRAVEINQRVAPTLLRLALAAVFVWFGALKIAGVSPVHELIAQTLPFVDADLAVPALGAVEVLVGLVLAIGVLPRITLLVLAGHLAGTFLTFVTASELMWGSNFLELTADGEFVVKNLVFISAALVLIGIYSRPAGTRARA
ncbi:DoxX family protein [Blastococcus sp. CT_GayMR20]|uniref:DoxX family protein n=1 Tax=Blastococcus sp. CT_GayMR20 TaxID=2559609 RepID=UPI00142F5EEA|nr:DoxX family protein [Blastococcus sp. CT_GayMR20]